MDDLNKVLKKRPAMFNRKHIILHHNNAKPHTALGTRQKIAELGCEILSHPPYSPDLAPSDYHLFLSRPVGRGGPIPWPQKSPDITPLDFYLWGTVKEIVYQTQINTPQQLMQRISDAFGAIKESEEDINNAIESIFRRCHSCIDNNGQDFETEL